MENGNSFYHFGPYHLNERECVLYRNGHPLALRPKAFDILLVLVRNCGHLVEKEELMRQVWPDTIVEEANLTQNIFTLRKLLGEGEEGKYIETVSRRGYRFVAPVKEISGPALAIPVQAEINSVDRAADSSTERPERFLAVLPFANASADSNMEYLSDGITESIINSLSQLPQLRVMSRSAVFRYKGSELDAQQIGRDLRVDAVLVGTVRSQGRRLFVNAELVDVANGWQLWGDNYDRGSRDIFEVQDEIARQISAALRLKLTGDQEQRLGKRYTENTAAYQAYLKGRYSWVKYTKAGLEKAIEHFRKAIHFDPNYVLAYAGSVDCYLRLATNYIPQEDLVPETATSDWATEIDEADGASGTSDETVRLRYEWDQKAAQREQKRAAESKSEYPAAHQWYAAYQFAINLFERTLSSAKLTQELDSSIRDLKPAFDPKCASQFLYSTPTPAEEIQILCAIAREQIDAGNYEAACLVLEGWWNFGEWPKLEGLNQHLSADLLFTAGNLAGWLASARQAPLGQKHAEALLSGAIGLFEQLGSRLRCADARIELAYCYFREGLFDLAASTLRVALDVVGEKDTELRSIGLVRLASIESRAGRLHDALSRLNEAGEIVEVGGPWATGRYHLELAITLKDLAVAEGRQDYFDQAIKHYKEARYEFEAIGNHRYNAIVENNHGYLLLRLGRFDDAETHLVRARKLFDSFADKVRHAQVDDTLALLYVAAERLELAEESISRSVKMLEKGGEAALLAESLTTQGLVLCRLGRHREAKRVLSRAHEVAERCGDSEQAGYALLIMIEEMCQLLDDDERLDAGARVEQLLGCSQQTLIRERLGKCLKHIREVNAKKVGSLDLQSDEVGDS